MVKTWFDMPQNQHLRHVVEYPNRNPTHRTTYENLIKPLIYPDYDQTTWQTAKPTNSFYNEMDHWFHTNLANTKLNSAWQAGLGYLVDKIDPKYFHYEIGRPVGLTFNTSLFYHLGASTAQNTQATFTNRSYMQSVNITTIKDQKIKKIG
jgi:hypothetical protein